MRVRVFVSIPVPNTAGLKPLIRDLGTIGGIRTSDVSQLHITLRFIGEVDEERLDDIERIVDDAINGIKKKRLSLKGLGVFPNQRDPKILWVGVDSELPLAQISECISRKFLEDGIPFDDKPFKSHVTVGRITGKCNLNHIISKYRSTEFATYIPSSVRIMKSESAPNGMEYSILRVCELED